jgi:hypothetical protein
MSGHREPRSLNLGRLLVWTGIAGLLVSFWVPWGVAQRTARTEDRADRLALLLLQTATPMQPLAGADDATLATLLARTQLLASSRGLFAEDLERIDESPPPGALATFANKHYLFQLAFSPPTNPRQLSSSSSLPLPLELMAWPREPNGPAHAAFFCSEVAEPAFSRNLQQGYVGLDRRPAPGSGYPRDEARAGQDCAYRDAVDERWLLRVRQR